MTKSDDEKRQVAERRVREREASRPYHQFVYQLSREREQIQEESRSVEGASAPGINTKAYKNLKVRWIRSGLWNKRWGILPGMLWLHEEPVEEAAAGPALAPAGPPVSRYRNIFGPPSPVESNHRQASGVPNSSQQGPSTASDPARLENGIAERSPSAPNLPRLGTDEQAHPSKVSKAAVKKNPGRQRRLNISPKIFSDGSTLSSSVDATKPQRSPPPDRVTPRRSKRIRGLPPASSVANDPAKTASTGPSKRAVRSKRERKVAGNLTKRSSAKPHGVSKRQAGKTRREKAREK